MFRTRVQTPAAGTNFDGTANQGLVDFLDLELPANDENIVPIITSISLDNDEAESIGVECFLKPAANPLTTTVRKTIRRPASTINSFNVDGCKIAVPRFVVGVGGVFTPWTLILITTGKTQTASFVVSYTLGPVGGTVY